MDVAGLVPGASEGRGRGNAFLADLANCDVLIQVVDAAGSTDLEGQFLGAVSTTEEAVASVNAEITFLEQELDAWIGGLLEDGWNRGVRRVQAEGEKGLVSSFKSVSAALAPPRRSFHKAWPNSTTLTLRLSNHGIGQHPRFMTLGSA